MKSVWRFCTDETWQVDVLAPGSRCQVHLWGSAAKRRSSPSLVQNHGNDVTLSSSGMDAVVVVEDTVLSLFVLSWHKQVVFIFTPTICLEDWAALNRINVIRDNDFHYSCTFPVSQLLFFLMVFVSVGLSSSLQPPVNEGSRVTLSPEHTNVLISIESLAHTTRTCLTISTIVSYCQHKGETKRIQTHLNIWWWQSGQQPPHQTKDVNIMLIVGAVWGSCGNCAPAPSD